MGTERNFRAFFQKIFNGRQRAVYSVFVGDNAVFHRHVEVAAHKHFFAV